MTLLIKGGFQITHNTIIIVQLRDIWGERESPFVQVVSHDHQGSSVFSMWEKCLHARMTLADIYQLPLTYDTHEPLSLQITNTLDLYYKERIHNARLISDIDEEAEAVMYYHQWLRETGRKDHITPPTSHLPFHDWDDWPPP